VRLVYDTKERRIWCQDCETEVETFDAFEQLVSRYSGALKELIAREQRVVEAENFALRSIAAKEMDRAWRARDSVPSCPHCGNGLFPEDFKHGVGTVGREYAEARRKRPAKGGREPAA
jgi:hypothetical protein